MAFFVVARYGGETPGEHFDGPLLGTSRIEFNYVPELGGTILLFVIGTVPLIWTVQLTRSRARDECVTGA